MPLVSSSKMLIDASVGKYAVGAFNVCDMELVQGVVDACTLERAPVILQIAKGEIDFAKLPYLVSIIKTAAEQTNIPIALHLDHAETFADCKTAIESGFTSVMIDASRHSYDENIEITSRVVEFAHSKGVSVEAALDFTDEIFDNTKKNISLSKNDINTVNVNLITNFVTRTGIDCLAIPLGTKHGAFKFDGEPSLNFDILSKISESLPQFPIVLHGASTIPNSNIDIINCNGGDLQGTKGLPENLLKEASKTCICKINTDSDLRIAFTAGVREHLTHNPSHYDPRRILATARKKVFECVQHKVSHVFDSGGKI